MDLRTKGNWDIIKGKLKEQYGDLTDDDLAMIEGQEYQVIGNIQNKLGKTKDEMLNEINGLLEKK